MGEAHEARLVATHERIMAQGLNIDPIGAARRCYTSGSSGTEEIVGY